MIWLKNTDGQKDAMLTFAAVAFLVVVVKVALHGASLVIGGSTFAAGTIDPGLIAALLTPTFGAYVARRYTDIRYDAVASLPDPGKAAEPAKP